MIRKRKNKVTWKGNRWAANVRAPLTIKYASDVFDCYSVRIFRVLYQDMSHVAFLWDYVIDTSLKKD